MHDTFTEIAVVVAAASLLSWLALVARQPIIVAYVAAGVLLGPGALGIVHGVGFIDEVSHIGVSLLLFLAGDHAYDNSKLIKAGYEFRYPKVKPGFIETVAWYQKEKWIPSFE